MPRKFKWEQIPKTRKGFVNYMAIPSPIVRRMVADAEIKKLQEEYSARIQWIEQPENENRIKHIERQLNHIEYIVSELPELENQ